MAAMPRDVRFAVRQLARSPGFAALAVVMVALGIAATTTIFTLVNTLFLRPPPLVRAPEQVVAVFTSDYSGPRYGYTSYLDYLDYVEAGSGVLTLGAFSPRPFGLATGRENLRVFGEMVTDNYFDVLGVPSALGAGLTGKSGPPAAGLEAVIGYGLWQRAFGGAPDIVGRTIRVSGQSFVVAGVAPRGFSGSVRGIQSELWIPLSADPQLNPGSDDLTSRGSRGLMLVGRLASAGMVAVAQARLDVAARRLHDAFPKQWTDRRGAPRAVTVVSERDARVPPQFRGNVAGFLALLMSVAGLVLVICCANLANLLLARGSARRRELAIRMALGAGRSRLIRQMLTEALIVAAAGGALGVIAANWAAELLSGLRPPLPIPVALDLSIDARILAFSAGVTLLTVVGFALLPALRCTRLDASPAIRLEGSAPRDPHVRFGLRDGLVVAQVAVSLLVLVAAGLLITSLRHGTRLDLGFQPDRVVTVQIELAIQGYSEARGREFYLDLERRILGLAGVESAGLAETAPLGFERRRRGIEVEGYEPQPGEEMEIGLNTVDAGYFGALGIPRMRGRLFDRRDASGSAPVAIVSQSFVDRFLPGADPIGRHLDDGKGPREIIGVVKDVKQTSLGDKPEPYFYVPFAQVYRPDMILLVRSARSSDQVLPLLAREVKALDPDLPLRLATMEEHLGLAVLPQRVAAWALGAFGLTGLVLAALGLYGVLSYLVSQRTREIGIRLALGATSWMVCRLVLRRGLGLTAIGLVLGLVAALGLTRMLSGLLIAVSPTDPVVLGGLSFLLSTVALFACAVPARRAARVDPAISLRSE
jgi:predicted permease